MYKGEILPNNSVALYEFSSNISIYCITDLRPCCMTPEQGEWYYLNGGPVATSEWISRYSNGTIALHIVAVSHDTWLYHCRLPNAANITQYIYVGFYSSYYVCK